jgi:hypothetical protein
MSDPNSPISIRLSEADIKLLKELGGDRVSTGVKKLIELYREGVVGTSEGTDDLSSIEQEIKSLKSSPFGFDKKEILLLEKELEKAKEKYKKLKTDSLKDRILKLVNSAS